MAESAALLRLLEPTVRPDGVGRVAPVSPTGPIEGRSFESMLSEARSLGDVGSVSQSGRSAGVSGSDAVFSVDQLMLGGSGSTAEAAEAAAGEASGVREGSGENGGGGGTDGSSEGMMDGRPLLEALGALERIESASARDLMMLGREAGRSGLPSLDG